MKKIKINILFFFVAVCTGILILLTNRSAGIGSGGPGKIFAVICAGCAGYFLPNLIKFVSEKRKRSKKNKELRFLKKLFVISGSVKPADFVKVLKVMIPRSKYYRPLLEDILENHKRSNTNMEEYYNNLRKEEDNLSEKLFCEKLNMAANYDFEKAVKSMEDDFVREQREYARFVRKKTEIIHIIGVVGMFLIITILMLWLLGPWLTMLSMDSYI